MYKHNPYDIVIFKMFTRKQKFSSGLVFLFCASWLLVFSGQASAMSTTEIGTGTFRKVNANTIIGTFQVGGQNLEYTFEDSDTADNTYNFRPQNNTEFCQNGFNDEEYGVTFSVNPNQGNGPLSALVRLGSRIGSGGCQAVQAFSVQVQRPANSNGSYAWDVDAIDDLNSSRNFRVTPGTEDKFYVAQTVTCSDISTSGGQYVILLDQAKGNAGTLFVLTGNPRSTAGSLPSSISGYVPGSCKLLGNPERIIIAGTYGNDTGTGGDGSGGTTPTTDTSDPWYKCASISATAFEWILCPMLRSMDFFIATMNNAVENLLFFDTAGGSENVEKAWSMFRYISTIGLVIIMLVMVLGQAISWGPFDAYTVRKMLPKLIAAAIFIQLSWPIMIIIINIFNDLGVGIANIMMAPFGGADQLSLDKVMAGDNGPDGSDSAFILAALIGGATIGGAVLLASGLLPALALLSLGIIISLLIGFVVLVVRKILIIMCLIFAPIAILLWILPGTKNYFDLWKNTFIGLLMMFPIIMALLASGRIFASIVANEDTFGGSGVGFGGFLTFFIVIICFFAPFWLIPKTFQWGGRVFGNLAGMVNNSRGVLERPRGYFQKQTQANKQYASQERSRRLSQSPEGAGTLDKALAGKYNIFKSGTLSPGARQRSFQQTLKEGQSAGSEAAAGMLLASGFDRLGRDEQLSALNSWARGDSALGMSSADNQSLREYALDQLTQQRRIGDLRDIAESDPKIGENAAWSRNMQKNFGIVNDTAPDLAAGTDLTSVGAERMAGWHDTTWDKWGKQMQDAQPGTPEYENGVGQAQAAIANPRVYDALNQTNKDIVQRLAHSSGGEVRQFRGPDRTTETILPGASALASPEINVSAQARQSLITNLQGTATGNRTAQAIAERLSTTNPDARFDRVAMEDFVGQVREAATSSPEMRDVYNKIVDAHSAYQDASVARVVETEVSKGNADVGAARATAQTAADAAKDRYQRIEEPPEDE